MKNVPKYVFFGGMGSAALVAVVLASVSTTGPVTESFLSQTDYSQSIPATPQTYQQLACADIPYDVAAVDVVLSGAAFGAREDVYVALGRASGSGDWSVLKKRDVAISETVSFSEASPTTVRFNFSSPVSVDTLCRGGDEPVYLAVHVAEGSQLRIHGSAQASAYSGPEYDCVLESGSPCVGGAVRDIAFALRSQVNSAPVITEMANRKVNELATLTFTLQATDPDGDAITWSSSALPENATLDAETGVFSFTPSSTQVGGFTIIFTATDDGGPVEQSSSIQMTITVVDVETPGETVLVLDQFVRSYGFDAAIEQSYVAHTKKLETFIANGQKEAAESQLSAFEKKLEQDLKKELLSASQHQELLAQIAVVRATLNAE